MFSTIWSIFEMNASRMKNEEWAKGEREQKHCKMAVTH